MSKSLCALSAVAGILLSICLGCGGQPPIPLDSAKPDASTAIEQKADPTPPDLTAGTTDAALKAALEWQQPLNPAFLAAAEAYEVPAELLLALAKIGSAFENRGDVRTIEGGYGLMALRDNELGGKSLDLAAQLTGVSRKGLIADPVASINGAAAVLNAYAVDAGVDRAGGIEAWLPAVVKYAGLDEEDSKFFAMGVYETLQIGFNVTNSFGETFMVVPHPLQTIDLASLVPPGMKQISLEDLAAGVNPDDIGPAPRGKENRLDVDYPGATWDPAASCNYTATSSSKDTVIVHTTEGSAAGTRSWFKNCASQVSSQYVVSEAGGVWQCVVESYKAWHVGCLNTRSVGIEHEGYASSPSHPAALYNASALLTRNICDRRGIPKAHNGCPPGILGHIDANNCVCGPGHTDPGAGWDWGYYINAVNGTTYTNPPYLFDGGSINGFTPGNSGSGIVSTGADWRGSMYFDQTGNDCWVYSPATNFGGAWAPQTVNVDFYPQSGTTPAHDMQLFWKTNAENFWDAPKSTPIVNYNAQNAWATVNLSINNNKWWGQTVNQLRLDFDQTNHSTRFIVNHFVLQNALWWHFDTGGDVMGWTAGNSLTAPWQTSSGWPGILVTDQTGNDAILNSPGISGSGFPYNYLGGVNDWVHVRVYPQSGNSAVHDMAIYWIHTGDGTWSESKSTHVTYYGQDTWVDVHLPVGSNPTWPAAHVTQLRLDFDQANHGTRWLVDYITTEYTGADTSAPSVPAGLAGTAISPTRVDLTWSLSTDNKTVNGYKIYRNNVQIGTSVAPSYSDTTCTQSTTYSYQVSAYDSVGNESAKCTAVNVTTPADIPLPTITQQPSAASVCPAGTATFTVAASGQGTLSYQWQKNSANITNGGHYSGATTTTLTVSSADANDAANYRCVVTNGGGSVNSNQAALTLKAATTITQQPAAQAVCAGATATFTVAATGDGTLSYQWQKDSVNLTGATAATLQITNVASGNVGSYRCVVTGGCGAATSNAAALSLTAATAISAQPQPASVAPFATANFSVTATGASLTYQWQKNGANLANGGNISGATTASLTISSCTSADQANYRCVVTGTCGAVTSNAAALTVVAIISDTFDSYGSQGAFEAVWTDTANSAYYLSTTFGNPGASVVMPSPSANSLGRYYRSLGGKYTGTAASPLVITCDFWLDAAGGPNWTGARHNVDLRGYSGAAYGQGTIENLIAIGVNNNSSDTFASNRYQARIVNGVEWQTLDEGSAPTRAGGWHQLKISISNNQVLFYVDGVLSETETRPNSFGFDWVVLGADLTAAGFQAAVDNVVVSGGVLLPAFTQQPQAQGICAGGSATFTVAVSGTGPFTYKWQKNGVDMANGGHVSGADTASLVISSADSGDAANYRCRVTNGDGSVTSIDAALTVTAAPAITQQPAAQSPCLGGTATFTVAATGQGTLTYQWQKDGVDLGGATSATLQITGVEAADVGNYRCVVSDPCGNDVTSNAAALALNAAPSISGANPQAITVEKNSTCGTPNQIVLTATDPDTAAGSLTWSIITPAATGTASFVGANTGASVTICYTPALDQFAADSFTVQVDDACGGPDTVTVNVTVQACPNLLVDSFSYANQAAFDAVWYDTLNSQYYFDAAAGNPGGAVVMLSPSGNNLGKYYRNLGGDFNGTDAAPLTLTFDFYLDAAGAPGWSGARQFVELRGYANNVYGSGSLENAFSIGVYNSSSDTFSTTRYQGRVLNGVGWQTLDEGSAPSRAAGWHAMKIEVTTSQVKFYVDGILSETEARPNSYGLDCVVIGSDLTSAGFAARVDNLHVTCGQ